ncbi:S24 family peptidase [Ancylobacter sp. MQZ15Z-1]|uniref:S24 family peptidase n=1 Tax=Ancylobacter mangrovi TaxID=2972472 RepID=A0A9X2PFM9_9HYPH|nr:S24 family peptidase [Ancylobacter mangrovi]MCS0497892.1 S24 family peptidase [Ancylobacter mangrovi]
MESKLQRVVEGRLKELNIGPVQAATAAGMERTFIRDIVMGRKTSVRQSSMPPLARALGWSVQQLNAALEGKSDVSSNELQPVTAALIPVRLQGSIEAGSWREVDQFDDVQDELIYDTRDPDFPQARLFANDVAGDSMNDLKPRPIMPGDRIISVMFDDLRGRVPLRDGMVVVIEQTRDGGQMRERSVKQLAIFEDHYEFHPRSTNPKHKPIVVNRDLEADDGRTVEVLGLVRKIMNTIPISFR